MERWKSILRKNNLKSFAQGCSKCSIQPSKIDDLHEISYDIMKIIISNYYFYLFYEIK